VRDIDFKVISAAENSNKLQKTRFWKEKSVEDVLLLECLSFNSSRRNCDVHLVSLKIQITFIKPSFWKEKSDENVITIEGLPFNLSIISFQNNVICCVHPTFYQVHTWANSTGHTSLSMKQGGLFVLFCTNEIHQTAMLQIVILISLESSQGEWVHWLGFTAFELAMYKFLNIE
jgi:hypothetical protein